MDYPIFLAEIGCQRHMSRGADVITGSNISQSDFDAA